LTKTGTATVSKARAAAHLAAWARRQPIAGLTVDVLKEPDMTSLLFIEVPAFRTSKANRSTVLAYAHFRQAAAAGRRRLERRIWRPTSP
jgi:hypothetical protein